jgi:hypothetical protein
VLIGLMFVDPNSFRSSNPRWTPTLPSATPGTFTMVDLLRFAKVDQASRVGHTGVRRQVASPNAAWARPYARHLCSVL